MGFGGTAPDATTATVSADQRTCGGPDYGVVWSNALVGAKANGSEPSPPNIMTYQGGSATMNVADGLTGFLKFFYSAPNASGGVAIYSGLDGTGSLLANGNLGSTPRTCGGTGPIIGIGDCWEEFKLDFSGVARSVVLVTKVGNIDFDDLTISLYTPAANVPEPAALGTFGLGGVVDRLVCGAASALRLTVSGQARAALRQPPATGVVFGRTPSRCASQPGVLCNTRRARGVLPQRRLETPRAVGAGLAGDRRFGVPRDPGRTRGAFLQEQTTGSHPGGDPAGSMAPDSARLNAVERVGIPYVSGDFGDQDQTLIIAKTYTYVLGIQLALYGCLTRCNTKQRSSSMNTVKALGLVGLATAGLFAAQAYATTVTGCPTSPVAAAGPMQGSPVCIAPYGEDGSTTGLATLLGPGGSPGSILSAGPGVNPYTQQVQTPYWSVNGTSGSVSTILIQIAGMKDQYTFGIFDPTNISNTLPILTNGLNGYQATLSVFADGGFSVGNANAPQVTFGATNLFGFYLTTPNGDTWYSLPTENSDGIAHMVAYEGGNGNVLGPYGEGTAARPGGKWASSEYILAWEDLPADVSDLDYNDFLVMVESVHPVPEPAVLGMFGLGLLAIAMAAGLRRRRSFEA